MKNHQTPRRLSVSSWSLKRELGAPDFYGVGDQIPTRSHQRDALLKLPAKLANFGIQTLEICHFHLPSREQSYLQELRASLRESEVEIWSLLVDDGDVTHLENGARDAAWIGDWIPAAHALGAKRMRVLAGQASDDKAINRSCDALRVLDEAAQEHAIRLMIENWSGVTSTPRGVSELLGRLEGTVGLCFDFGNWDGREDKITTKYDDLKQIAPLAESCHAKAHFDTGQRIDRRDYARCLDIVREADFSGPFTLIFDSDGDEWRALETEMKIVEKFL